MFKSLRFETQLFSNHFSLDSIYPELDENEGKEILLISEETLPEDIIEPDEIFVVFPKNKNYVGTLCEKKFLNFFQYMFDLYPEFNKDRKTILMDKEKSYSLIIEFGNPYFTSFSTENKRRIVIIQGISVKRKLSIIDEKEEEMNLDFILKKIPNNLVTPIELYRRVIKNKELMIIEGYDSQDYKRILRDRMLYKNL